MIMPQETKQCPFCQEILVQDVTYMDSDFNIIEEHEGVKITESFVPIHLRKMRKELINHPYCPNHRIFFNVSC